MAFPISTGALRAAEDPSAAFHNSLSALSPADQARAVSAILDEAQGSIDRDLEIVTAVIRVCGERSLTALLDEHATAQLVIFQPQVSQWEKRQTAATADAERYIFRIRQIPT